jgi:hypothetical protein
MVAQVEAMAEQARQEHAIRAVRGSNNAVALERDGRLPARK